MKTWLIFQATALFVAGIAVVYDKSIADASRRSIFLCPTCKMTILLLTRENSSYNSTTKEFTFKLDKQVGGKGEAHPVPNL